MMFSFTATFAALFLVALLSFIFSEKLSKAKRRRGPADLFLFLGSLSLCLFTVFFCAEIIFFLEHKSLYFYKSQLRLSHSYASAEKRDAELADKDYDGNLLFIGQKQLLEGRFASSRNAHVLREGGSVVLSSLDDKPAFMEISIPVNKSAVFYNKPYPYLLSFSAAVNHFSADTSPVLAINYLDRESSSPPSYQQPFKGRKILLTVSPHYAEQDIYFDSGHRQRHKEEIMRLKISITKGRVSFSGLSLIALRQYGIFNNRISVYADKERFNSAMGLFLQKINYKKSPGLKRILFLGGSTIYGANYSTVEATIPKWLDFKLQAAYPGEYEVFNCGINSASTLSMVNGLTPKKPGWQRRRGSLAVANEPDYLFDNLRFNYLDLAPDAVIITPMYNDFFLYKAGDSEEKRFERLITNPPVRFIFENFAIGYYIFTYIKADYQKKISQRIINSGSFLKSYADNPSGCVKKYKANLGYIIKTLKSRGIRTYLSSLPNPALYRLAPSLPDSAYSFYFEVLKKINDVDEGIIKSAAEENGVPYIDLRGYFRNFPEGMDKYLYSADYFHLQPLGNAIAADILYSALAGDFP